MHAALAREQPVRVPALHRERRRAEPGLGARLHLVELDGEAAPLAPSAGTCAAASWSSPARRCRRRRSCTAQIASRSSCSPVNSARSSSVSSSPPSASMPAADLGLDRRRRPPRARARRASRGRSTVPSSRVDERRRRPGRCASSVVTLRGAVLVVPEVGLARPRPRARRAGPGVVDPQVGARALDAAAQFGRGRRRSRAWGGDGAFSGRGRACTSCRCRSSTARCGPGVLSTRTGIIDSGSARAGSARPPRRRRRRTRR